VGIVALTKIATASYGLYLTHTSTLAISVLEWVPGKLRFPLCYYVQVQGWRRGQTGTGRSSQHQKYVHGGGANGLTFILATTGGKFF
jgi:hypothetical protein